MVSAETRSVIARAKQLYADQLKEQLELEHLGRYVSIEPESGDYFLGDSFDEAVRASRKKHPARVSHTIRIGHPAAFCIGGTQL